MKINKKSVKMKGLYHRALWPLEPKHIYVVGTQKISL